MGRNVDVRCAILYSITRCVDTTRTVPVDRTAMDLFEYRQTRDGIPNRPLAERMRPRTLDEVVGQDHLVGPGRILRRMVETRRLFPIILWGPPGTGKTSLAQVLSGETDCPMVAFSAVLSGVKDIRRVVEEARQQRALVGKSTVLFVDELHRFNKSQQDAFLPHVESGLLVLIGATTENPSFELNSALLSRCKVLTVRSLEPDHVNLLLQRAVEDVDRGLGADGGVELTPDALNLLVRTAHGDARTALTNLEIASALARVPEPGGTRIIDEQIALEAAQRKTPMYDKAGEEHFNLISALHKSLRGGDADAGLYWLARMLEGGEEPMYIARRLVRFASEDVGNADPNALLLAVAAQQACHFIGLPEGDTALAQLVVYLAAAPKSNACYTAIKQAREVARETQELPVPLQIRNAPTDLMKGLGYGKDYKYAHDHPDAIVEQDYLPEHLQGRRFYHPTDRGRERQIAERLAEWRRRMKRDDDRD